MANGGRRPGAGRKRGSKGKTTLEREEIAQRVRDVIAGRAQSLIDAQTVSALGYHKIVVREEVDGMPKLTQVHDKDEIERLIIEGTLGEDYFIIVGSKPDWKAADALLDRSLGKAISYVDLSTKGKEFKGIRELSDEQLARIIAEERESGTGKKGAR